MDEEKDPHETVRDLLRDIEYDRGHSDGMKKGIVVGILAAATLAFSLHDIRKPVAAAGTSVDTQNRTADEFSRQNPGFKVMEPQEGECEDFPTREVLLVRNLAGGLDATVIACTGANRAPKFIFRTGGKF